MSKILIPTDFSDTARNAIAYAIRLAKQVNADLVVFHANDPAYARSEDDIRETIDNLRHEIEPGLQGQKVEYTARHGILKEILPTVAAEFGIDLILMGTNGVSGGAKFKWGSNAYAVIDESRVPVLVVPPEAEFQGFQRMTLAIDFRADFSNIPVLPLLKMMQLFGGEIFVLSVLPETGVNLPHAVMDVKKISSLLKNTPHSFHYVYSDNTEKAIVDFSKWHYVDAIITLPKKHSWLIKLFNTSHTQNLVYQIQTPVLAVQE